MLGIAESNPLPPNYGYGMTGNFSIPIPENVLTLESPVVQQNKHLMDKLGRVPVMPVTLPAPLEKPAPSQALIWPVQKSEGLQDSALVDPFAVKKEETLADPFANKPGETPTDPFADKTNDTPADPFADKPEDTPEDPFADKPEEALSNPFTNKPEELSILSDPFTESKPEETSVLPDPFTGNKPEASILPDPFTDTKSEESTLPNPFTDTNPEETSVLPDPFTENKPETSVLPDPFTENKPEENAVLPDPFTDNKPEESSLSNAFTDNKPEETSVLPGPFTDNKPEESSLPNPFTDTKPKESSSLPNPFSGNKPESSPLPESIQEKSTAFSDPLDSQPSPSDDLFASLSPTPDTRQQEIDTIFDTSNTSMMKRPSQTLAEIRASSTLSNPESQQPAEDPFANVSTPVDDLFMGMTSHETPEPEILTDMSNPEIITETTNPEKPTETPIPEIPTEGKPLSRLTPGTLLPADSPEDLRKAAEAIGVNMKEPETPVLIPQEVQAVDVVKYFQEDEELGSDEEDGKRLRILFDNMLPVVDENPVIPEPEEMAEQVICKARALLTMLDSLSVSWTQQKKKKRLVNQVKKILDERCYSEIGYDIKVCEKLNLWIGLSV